jgi:hypothetical protein
MIRALCVVALGFALCGCATRTWRLSRDAAGLTLAPPARNAPAVPLPRRGDAAWVDLQPGWQVRTITPILKSGGFVMPTVARARGNTIELDSSGEFLGMETAFYLVQPGVRFELKTVEATVDGRTERRSKPLLRLFETPAVARFARFVYLTRASRADHDMAFLTAATREELEDLTRRVQSNPGAACQSNAGCAWVPPGIAVLAQVRVTVDGADKWIPADGSVRDALPRNLEPVEVLRMWRGKPMPVSGTPADLAALPVAQGDVIRTR